MAEVLIREGTPDELAPYLAEHPNQRFRLIELTDEAAQEPVLDEKAKAAIAMLDSWIAEGEAATEAERVEAQRELDEFKRNMNANRAATGERPLFP